MTDIFVSYAHQDRERIAPLVGRLQQEGWSVWWDRDIAVGRGYEQLIDEEISKASCVVVAWSEAALASRWVHNEALEGLERDVLIPLKLDDVRIPVAFRQTQTALLLDWPDSYDEDELDSLLAGIRDLVEGSDSTDLEAATKPFEPADDASVSEASDDATRPVPPEPEIIADQNQSSVPPAGSESGRSHRPKRNSKFIAVTALIAVAIGSVWFGLDYWNRHEEIRAARTDGIVELESLIANRNYHAAFQLATELEGILEDAPVLASKWDQFSSSYDLATDPMGASVFVKPYENPEDEWQFVGKTPLPDVRLANGLYRVRAELEGHKNLEFVDVIPLTRQAMSSTWSELPPTYVLPPEGKAPTNMVFVQGGVMPTMISGDSASKTVDMQGYYIDKTEVTNREFQAFVNVGGYDKEEYWADMKFVRQGESLSIEEARSAFVDRSGRPGPAGWRFGRFPDGQEDFPVTGVSWYEARAYARFMNKELPTVYHWRRASSNYLTWATPLSASIVSQSNFGDSLAAAGTYTGMGQFGPLDTAGNAREWAFNETGKDKRAVLGGSYADAPYMFVHTSEQSPMARHTQTGFRLMRRMDPGLDEDHLTGQVATMRSSTGIIEPVSEVVYDALASQLQYRRLSPEVTITELDSEGLSAGRVEEVELTFPNGEHLKIYLLFPAHAEPPYQAVIPFPGQHVFQFERPVKQFVMDALAQYPFWTSITDSGRVLVYPEYYGAHEQYNGYFEMDDTGRGLWVRDAVVAWRQEIGQTIDYLETRRELNVDKLAYVGTSFGAFYPIATLAVEDRIKVAVLLLGGVLHRDWPPLANSYNFVPRITLPVLQINGRYDPIFDHETSQLRLFDLLGTPDGDKEMVVFEGGHGPSEQQAQRVTLRMVNWLDEQLGVPER